MRTQTILEVTVDYANLLGTRDWHRLQKRIDAYNQKKGMPKGLSRIYFEIDISKSSFIPKEIQQLVNGIARGAVGLEPFREVENECAVETISIKGTNVIIEMNGVGEAEETSKFVDPNDNIVYRGFRSWTSCEYEDYRLGTMVGQGYFC